MWGKLKCILTEDNGLVRTGSTTSYVDLCLYIVEKFGSQTLAVRCSKSLLIEPRTVVPSLSILFSTAKKAIAIKKSSRPEPTSYMEKKITETISIEALAVTLGISSSHFKRRFKKAAGDTSLAYLQRIRVVAAKQKLKTTTE